MAGKRGSSSVLEVGAWVRQEQERIRGELDRMRKDTARLREEAAHEAERKAALEQELGAIGDPSSSAGFLLDFNVPFSAAWWHRVAYAGLVIASGVVLIFFVSFILYRTTEGTSEGFLTCFRDCNVGALECVEGCLCGCSPRARIMFWTWTLMWSVGLAILWQREILQPFLRQLIVFAMIAIVVVAVVLLAAVEMWMKFHDKFHSGVEAVEYIHQKVDKVLHIFGFATHTANDEDAAAGDT